MKCSHCASENVEGAHYCSQCGRIMTSPTPSPVAAVQPVITPPVMSATPTPMEPQAAPIVPAPLASPMGIVVPPPRKKRNYKKWLLILIGIIVLPFVVIAAAGVFASIFEAAITKGEAEPQTNNAPFEVPAGSYQSPDRSFIVNFPNAVPENIQIIPSEGDSTSSTLYIVDYENSALFVTESKFKQPLDVLAERTLLENWAAIYAESRGGKVVAAEFAAGEYTTLNVAVDGKNEDVVARMMVVDSYTAYMLGYILSPGATPDNVAYTDFLESFVYLGGIQGN